MDKGNIHNQGNPKKRLYLNKEIDIYMYPHQTSEVVILEFGSFSPDIKEGCIISTATGKMPYDSGLNGFSAHSLNQKVDYPYQYHVRCHPVGYNYDQYMEGMDEGFHGFDYYVVDSIITKEKIE